MGESQVDEVRAVLAGHPPGPSSLLAVLEDVQGRFRYLPRDALILLSERLPVPLSQVYSVATFYNAFSLVPQGRHRCQVCTGTACHVRGAMQVLDRLGHLLGVAPGETTPDLEYTLETVNCLGACALGPIVVTDVGYEGQMTGAKVDRMLKRLRRMAEEEDG